MTYYNEKPSEAYVLSLLGGLVISLVGLVWLGMMFTGTELNWFSFMMQDYENHMILWELGSFGYAMGFIGLITGVGIIGSSIMMQAKPENHITWGSIIIVLSALSLLGGMGGMGIGLILGLVGGILAIIWKPIRGSRTHDISTDSPQ